jgi:hypothetical protein
MQSTPCVVYFLEYPNGWDGTSILNNFNKYQIKFPCYWLDHLQIFCVEHQS